METHLGRLQVELYKAIKKDDVATRTLRAALSKFADLAHLVKVHAFACVKEKPRHCRHSRGCMARDG